ncbi:MAG: hypothetical protein K2X81_17070 [Candidatus Obscuribacterales bacterium]|nr:hypothetical protein [Candidatus Obscuribacterales bacterium]
MYGLLKSCACNSSKKERDLKRLAYCGTCKAMGALYGQRSRLLLNNDATFLAELLLAKRTTAVEMNGAFASFNCMLMPSAVDIPVELEISSSVNLLLAEFKCLDRLADAHGIVSEFAYRAFSKGFAEAASKLVALNFPVQESFSWLKEQEQREKSAEAMSDASLLSVEQKLHFFAEATVKVTSSFFRQAAVVCGFDAETDNFAELGNQFGSLIYILDALEDYQRDFARQDFNAIRSAYQLDGALSVEITQELVEIILESCENITEQLDIIQLEHSSRELFKERFRNNTRKRLSKFALGKSISPACHRKTQAENICSEPPGFELAKAFARRISLPLKSGSLVGKIFVPFAVAYAFVFAVLCPSATKDVGSIRDCLEMPFNLIFLSYLISRLSNPRALVFASAGTTFGANHQKPSNAAGAFASDSAFFNVGNRGRRKKKDSEEEEGGGSGGNDNCRDCDCGPCDCWNVDCCDSSCCDCCGGGHHGGACCGDVQCCDCGAGDCSACDCGSGSADCGSCDCNCSH